ncbi:MAG: hypothetical protein KAV83_06455 [Desulfobacterales bacterium]|nr:hypothetical protein [Desulfobacterales bacterium]
MKTRVSVLAVTLLVASLATAAYGDEEKKNPCPAVSSFPLLDQVLGKDAIKIGDSLLALNARLSKIGTKEVKGDDVGYILKPKGVLSFDVHSVKFDFHSGRLKRVKIIYQVAPAGTKKKSELDATIDELLGKIDGHIKGPEGRLLKAWKKGTVLIALDYNDVIMWYMIEIFDQGK